MTLPPVPMRLCFEADAVDPRNRLLGCPDVGDEFAQASCLVRSIGIPGLYVTDDPGAKEKAAKQGNLSLRLGLGWASPTPSTPARRRC